MSSEIKCCLCTNPAQIGCKCEGKAQPYCRHHFFDHQGDDFELHKHVLLRKIKLYNNPDFCNRLIKLDKIILEIEEFKSNMPLSYAESQESYDSVSETIKELFKEYEIDYSKVIDFCLHKIREIQKIKSDPSTDTSELFNSYCTKGLKGVMNGLEMPSFKIQDILEKLNSRYSSLGGDMEIDDALQKTQDELLQKEIQIQDLEEKLKQREKDLCILNQDYSDILSQFIKLQQRLSQHEQTSTDQSSQPDERLENYPEIFEISDEEPQEEKHIAKKKFINLLCMRNRVKLEPTEISLRNCVEKFCNPSFLASESSIDIENTLLVWSDRNLGPQEFYQLLEEKRDILTNLKFLDVSVNSIQDEGIRYLRDFSINLCHLILSNNNITDKGLLTLANMDLPNLTGLELSKNCIQELEISHANWPNLRELYLDDNIILNTGLEKLEESNFPELIRLNLSCNKITANGFIKVLKCRFPKLEVLDISKNAIAKGLSLLSDSCFQNLKELNLKDTRLIDSYTKPLIGMNFTSLEILNLSRNSLGPGMITHLVSMNLPKLKKLNLNFCFIQNKGFCKLICARFPELEELKLNKNSISGAFKDIPPIDLPHLRILNLSNNSIEEAGVNIFSNGLPELKHLRLMNNNLGGLGLEKLCRFKFPNLEYLDLENNGITKQGIRALANSAIIFTLVKLDLGFNFEISSSFKDLFSINLQNLKSLNLRNNRLGDDAMIQLSQASFPNIEYLDLSCNKIAELGLEAFANAVFINLRSLNLSNNIIGPLGLLKLKTANFPNLTSLDLSSNQILSKSMKVFMNPSFRNITYLNLEDNSIGSDGLRTLISANLLELQQLYLSKNLIKSDGIKELLQAKLQKIQILDLRRNSFSNFKASQLIREAFPSLISYQG